MLLRGLLKFASYVEAAARILAASMMMAVMLIVVTDVVLRYAFNSPLSWAYDFVSLYLMVGIFFLILSETYIAGAHIAVDLLVQRMPPRMRGMTEMIVTGSSVGLFVLIAAGGAHQLDVSWANNDVLAGAIPWPTWPGYALVLVGASLLALRLALQLVARSLSFLAGQDMFPEARPRMESIRTGE